MFENHMQMCTNVQTEDGDYYNNEKVLKIRTRCMRIVQSVATLYCINAIYIVMLITVTLSLY